MPACGCDREVPAELYELVPLAPLHRRITWQPLTQSSSACLTCRKWLVSTPASLLPIGRKDYPLPLKFVNRDRSALAHGLSYEYILCLPEVAPELPRAGSSSRIWKWRQSVRLENGSAIALWVSLH
jgi:hypothetical protein